MSALSVVVVEWCATSVGMSPTAQGLGAVMTRCGGRCGTEGEKVDSWIVGHEAYA